MHHITVRKLYHEVTLEVGSPTDAKLTSFINPRNIGLPHIRKLDLYLAEVADKCNQLQQAHFAIRMILEFLPENILEKFSWHPWSPFLADNLVLLYKKQRRMEWLEGIALDRNVLPELEKQPDFGHIFSKTRRLGLYPDSRDVLNFCASLLKRTKRVEKITLHASFDEDTDRTPIPSRELNDSSTDLGLITRTMFGHMEPFEKCTPLSLKDLTLQKINLRYAANSYCKFIDFRVMKALRIFGCPGADSLFAELSKSHKLPERLETLEFKHDDNQENDALNALDGFLKLVSGIRVLTMDICYAKQLPSSDGIIRHSRTLKELNMHGSRGDGEEEELVADFEDFEKICQSCTLIEQLSVAFPTTSLIRPISDAFQAFEVSSNYCFHIPRNLKTDLSSTERPRRPRKPNYSKHNNMANEYPLHLSSSSQDVRNPAAVSRKLRLRTFDPSRLISNSPAVIKTRRHCVRLLRSCVRSRGFQESDHFCEGQTD